MGPGWREDLGRGAGGVWGADRRATHFIPRRQPTGPVSRALSWRGPSAAAPAPRSLQPARTLGRVARTAAASPRQPRPPRVRSPPGPPPPPLAPGPASAEGRPGASERPAGVAARPELGLQGRAPPAPAAPRRPEAGAGEGSGARVVPAPPPLGGPKPAESRRPARPAGGAGRGTGGGMWPQSRPSRMGAGAALWASPSGAAAPTATRLPLGAGRRQRRPEEKRTEGGAVPL